MDCRERRRRCSQWGRGKGKLVGTEGCEGKCLLFQFSLISLSSFVFSVFPSFLFFINFPGVFFFNHLKVKAFFLF